MRDFDLGQRLEYLEHELASSREAITVLQGEIRGAAEWLALTELPTGAKVTDVLAAHGHALTAIMRRLDVLESEVKRDLRLR